MAVEYVRKNALVIKDKEQLKTVGDEIGNMVKSLNDLDKKIKTIKNAMYDAMVKFNIEKWQTPNGTQIIAVKPSEDKKVMKFDEKAFASAHPRLYKEFCKETVQTGKSGYIRVITAADTID